MTVENKPNARVQVMNVPQASPGKCAICGFAGQDGERKYIDFGLDLDFYGTVYLCSHCMIEVAVALEYIDPDTWIIIKIENDHLRAELEATRNERNSLANTLRHYLDGIGGVGAVAESQELPEKSEPLSRSTDTKPESKSKSSSNPTKSGSNDSSNSDGDIISLD